MNFKMLTLQGKMVAKQFCVGVAVGTRVIVRCSCSAFQDKGYCKKAVLGPFAYVVLVRYCYKAELFRALYGFSAVSPVCK